MFCGLLSCYLDRRVDGLFCVHARAVMPSSSSYEALNITFISHSSSSRLNSPRIMLCYKSLLYANILLLHLLCLLNIVPLFESLFLFICINYICLSFFFLNFLLFMKANFINNILDWSISFSVYTPLRSPPLSNLTYSFSLSAILFSFNPRYIENMQRFQLLLFSTTFYSYSFFPPKFGSEFLCTSPVLDHAYIILSILNAAMQSLGTSLHSFF